MAHYKTKDNSPANLFSGRGDKLMDTAQAVQG